MAQARQRGEDITALKSKQTTIEELKNSFLVYEQGMTLEDAADCYDEMNDGYDYRNAVAQYLESQE